MVKQLGAWLGNHAHDLLFKTIHQRYLIYNMCWEDPRIEGVRAVDSKTYPLTLALSPMNGGEGTEWLPQVREIARVDDGNTGGGDTVHHT